MSCTLFFSGRPPASVSASFYALHPSPIMATIRPYILRVERALYAGVFHVCLLNWTVFPMWFNRLTFTGVCPSVLLSQPLSQPHRWEKHTPRTLPSLVDYTGIRFLHQSLPIFLGQVPPDLSSELLQSL